MATACPVEEMVEIAETMNRLRMLQPWLQARVATSSTKPGTHNALGKIYIQLNKDHVKVYATKVSPGKTPQVVG